MKNCGKYNNLELNMYNFAFLLTDHLKMCYIFSSKN